MFTLNYLIQIYIVLIFRHDKWVKVQQCVICISYFSFYWKKIKRTAWISTALNYDEWFQMSLQNYSISVTFSEYKFFLFSFFFLEEKEALQWSKSLASNLALLHFLCHIIPQRSNGTLCFNDYHSKFYEIITKFLRVSSDSASAEGVNISPT